MSIKAPNKRYIDLENNIMLTILGLHETVALIQNKDYQHWIVYNDSNEAHLSFRSFNSGLRSGWYIKEMLDMSLYNDRTIICYVKSWYNSNDD